MTGYAGLSSTQIDADSPLIEDTLIKLRDNPLAMFEGAVGAPRIQTAAIDAGVVTNAKMAVDSVGQSELIAGGVHQAELNTSAGEVSKFGLGVANIVLPGGGYGFWPTLRKSNTGTMSVNASVGAGYPVPSNASYTATMSMEHTTFSGETLYAKQRYINSSPPYNLGDGDIPLFFFGMMRAGVLIETYVADVPPWAYNGPTKVTADIVSKKGQKFKREKSVDKESGKVTTTLREITHAVKNADMGLIPHPFSGVQEGDEVVLLNPPDTLDLLEMHEAGESITQLFSDDYLRFDNSPISRATPLGVKACGYKWRNSKR